MDAQDVFEVIVSNINSMLESPPKVITFESQLDHNEIGLDSLAYLTLLICIEDHYNFEFDDTELNFNEIQTVGDLVSLVMNKQRQEF